MRVRAHHPNRIGANPVAVKSHELAARKGRLANHARASEAERNAQFGPAPTVETPLQHGRYEVRSPR